MSDKSGESRVESGEPEGGENAAVQPAASGRVWGDEEIALLTPGVDIDALAEQLGRTPGAIRAKAKALGVPLFDPAADPRYCATAAQADEAVEPHRRCPLCWGTRKGFGWRYSATASGRKRYYKCKMCGHTWSVVIKPTEILRYPLQEELAER